MPKILDTSGLKVGEVKPWSAATAQDGWLLLSGGTISDTGNGGTVLASAYARDLFVFLWTNYSNTELVIQTSAGAPTTRGASALADFTTNDRRMPLPDLRGRTWLGKDDMGGVAASRMTSGGSGVAGNTLGAVGGTQTHNLTEAQLAAHNHRLQRGSGSVLDLTGSFGIVGGSVNHGTYLDSGAGSQFIEDSGSGTAHQNTQPSFVGTYVIKY